MSMARWANVSGDEKCAAFAAQSKVLQNLRLNALIALGVFHLALWHGQARTAILAILVAVDWEHTAQDVPDDTSVWMPVRAWTTDAYDPTSDTNETVPVHSCRRWAGIRRPKNA